MDLVKKRVLPQEFEFEEAKRLVIPSARDRPAKHPVKRRKTEDSLGMTKCNYSGGDQKAGSKGKRQAWTAAAIEAFFEGLYQHGKHFHHILKHMQSKQKKLNDLLIPNLTKDQVRFFYYRTWRKVEPHLEPTQQSGALTLCEPSKKTKPSHPTGDCSSVHSATVVEEVMTHADYSTEDYEGADEVSPKKSFELLSDVGNGGNDPSTFSPTSLESSEKISELGGTSPGASIDKGESKVKYVVINGVKQSLDIVALICYHKLKQKCQVVDHNFWKRLSELIYQGTTTIPSRVKGKRRIQIKVPNCGALRGKLTLPIMNEDPIVERIDENPVIGDSDEICEPTSEPGTSGRSQLEADMYLSDESLQVTMELRPLNSATWAHLQGLSLNPRIRITVGASKRLVDLLQMLCSRWKVDKADINIYHRYTMCGVHKMTTVSSRFLQKDSLSDLTACKPSSLCGDVHSVQDGEKMTSGGVDIASMEDDAHAPAADFNNYLQTSKDDDDQQCLGDSCIKQLEFHSETTICDLHNYFCRPDYVQLLYSLPHVEEPKSINSTSNKLKVLLKIVELMTKGTDVDNHDSIRGKDMRTPSKVMSMARQSPKVVEYMKSLEKRSPRRSPLAKYHKLKARSPYRLSVNQLKPKRVQLDFTIPHSPTAAVTKTESVLSTLTVGKAPPEVIQLSKPTSSFTSKSSVSKEAAYSGSCSFTTVKLQDVLSHTTNSTVKDSSATSSTSVHMTSSGSMSSPTVSAATHSKRVPHPLLSAGASQVQPLRAQLPQDCDLPSRSPPVSLQPRTTDTSQYTAMALQPGHHVLRPKPNVTPPSVSGTQVTDSVPTSTAGTPPGLFYSPSLLNTCNTSTSAPIVSTLKPFSKPRRTKKVVSRTGQTRQLVPRPLPFLPQPQMSSVGQQHLHSPLPASVNLLSTNDQQNAVPDGTNVNPTRNTLMLALLQAVMQQQRKLKQQMKLRSDTSTSQVVKTTVSKEAHSEIPVCDREEDVITGDVVNLLEDNHKVAGSQEEMFNTSSDTVNNLLRGLSCTKETESIKKLTEETANVLPTFAKVLDQSTCQVRPCPNQVSSLEKLHRVEDKSVGVESSALPLPDGTENELSSVSMSELLGNLTDSTFKQISEKEDILDNVNFSDVFSQLREEVMSSTEKFGPDPDTVTANQTKDHSDESMSSIGCLLDYLNSGEEDEPLPDVGLKSSGASQMGDSTYCSLMEESSVDYIQKFKELASSMEHNESL